MDKDFTLRCPMPHTRHTNVQMAHGGGGRMMQQLISDVFLKAFGRPGGGPAHDAAVVDLKEDRLAFTTDSYVVHPLIFPGGDIGSMAVYGTVNDLAMAGARPLCLSAAFIIEEGLPMDTLKQVVRSMQDAAERAHVQIVTGDTKVVDRGKGDGIFINTAGIGLLEHPRPIHPLSVRRGDVVLVNGDVGRHGMAVMAAREGLAFESPITSDSAPVADVVLDLLSEGVEVHCLRDVTRGGLSSALNEISEASGLGIRLDEGRIPVREDVRGACEVLGLDPLYVACEGRFVAFVAPTDAERALEIMRTHALGEGACAIGHVQDSGDGVTMTSRIGAVRVVDMLSGEQLPRIC